VAHQVWAVKKSKQPYTGLKDRERRIREVDILKALVNSDHVVNLMDSWEYHRHLYIQTEYCEEGSLDVFLAQAGLKARIDDFRIWKILLELSLGLKHIHDKGFIHLDLKPANILVTFEGVLKIGDFGMATRWPAENGFEGEGDREYIGPEILMGRFDKPADIFSLGLIMFEIAGNVELPDNGVSWQKLRNGDMSDVPSLTWSSETSIFRDASGNPISEEQSFDELCASELGGHDFGDDFLGVRKVNPRKSCRAARSGELVHPPNFMIDARHDQALDKIVRWMISPDPLDRPTADQILENYGVQFVNRRRRAGATVFEGNWGPADEILAEDAEMIDV
jgi:mitosis inhibitor protein kinase SWE1